MLDSNTGAVVSGPLAFTNGADIDFNGWRLAITGTPQAGDRFTVEANTDGVADNRNALALGGLQNAGVLDNSVSNLQESYSSLVGQVGTQTAQTKVNLGVQEALLDSVVSRRDSVSGVNLDEEAADLIRFQQAYQAAARVIATADELFLSTASRSRSAKFLFSVTFPSR